MAATHSNLLTTAGAQQNANNGGPGTGGGSAGSGAAPGGEGNPTAVSLARYQNHQQQQGYNSGVTHSSQNGPRSLSDSSQAESPVQDDLLTSSNTPNSATNSANAENGVATVDAASSFPSLILQHHHHQQQQHQQQQLHNHGQSHGHPGYHHHHQHHGQQQSGGGGGGHGAQHQSNHSSIYGGNGGVGVGTGSTGNNGGNCNGSSLYPVLPASLLYSQLYSAANQSHHSFHGGHNVTGHNPNSVVNGELQSVMDQITTSAAGLGNGIGLGNTVGGLVAGEDRRNRERGGLKVPC